MSILGKQIRKQLETNFKVELCPELKIQRGEEEIEPKTNDPIESSTPLKTEQIEQIYNPGKEEFLKTALTINKTDLETSVAMAKNSNEAVLDEIITPGSRKTILYMLTTSSILKKMI